MATTSKPSETYIIVFSSTHHMIHAEYRLEKSNIPITLYPTPPEFEELCLTAITFPSHLEEKVEAILKSNHIETKGIYPFDSSKLKKTEELIKTKLTANLRTKSFWSGFFCEKLKCALQTRTK